MEIDQILDTIAPLPQAAKEKIKLCIQEVHYPKGYVLIKADKIETKLYFIKKGIVRAFATTATTDVTFWFGKEAETVVSMKSYVSHEKGYENIELLEDSSFYEINSAALHHLYQNDIDIANWGRKFAELELVKTEERLIARQFKTASERYLSLIQDTPHLLQRVSLGHLASYLGITQVSLSRIRAEIK